MDSKVLGVPSARHHGPDISDRASDALMRVSPRLSFAREPEKGTSMEDHLRSVTESPWHMISWPCSWEIAGHSNPGWGKK